MEFARHKLAVIALVLCCALSLTHCKGGCSSTSETELTANNVDKETHTQRLPERFPVLASETATALAEKIPANTQFSVFIASHGALVQLLSDIKRWGVFKPNELEKSFRSLSRHYGIDPSHATSYLNAGFDLEGGTAISHLGHNYLFVIKTLDQRTFDAFLDTFINEEFGRPRRRPESNKDGLDTIFVLAQDFVTIAYKDGYCLFATGSYFDPDARPSAEVISEVLALTPATALSGLEGFNATRAQVEAEGPVMLYTPNASLARSVLDPLSASHPLLERFIKSNIIDSVQGFGGGFGVSTTALSMRSFILLSKGKLSAMRSATTPKTAEIKPIRALIQKKPEALLRVTFQTNELEEQLMQVLDEEAVERWKYFKEKRLKVKKSGFLLADLELALLHNLAGHALIAVERIDRERLQRTDGSLNDLAQAVDLTLYIPVQDADAAGGLFSGASMFQGAILGQKSVKKWLKKTKSKIDIQSDDGATIITYTKRGKRLIQLMYKDGLIIVLFGQHTTDDILARFKNQGAAQWSADPSLPSARLLGDGRIWGLSLNARALVDSLASRFKVVGTQLKRFLAPLQQASIEVVFEENGLVLRSELAFDPRPPEKSK